MANPLHVSASRTYPVPADEAYAFTLPLPLEELFPMRYGPIPPITGTDQEGVWGEVGQVRTIHTGDGGSLRERLVEVSAPARFAYEITDVTGHVVDTVSADDVLFQQGELKSYDDDVTKSAPVNPPRK